MRNDTLELAGTSPGTRYELSVLRFGTGGTGRKAYIQAALHADEVPGMIAAHHLRQRLAELEAAAAIVGEIVLVPMANPIGLSQRLLGVRHGRFHFGDGVNFNRDHADMTDTVAGKISGRLTADGAINRDIIRGALREAAAAIPAVTAADHLKKTLLTLAVDADTVLDLHCDGEAVMHLYTTPQQVDTFLPLAALLGAHALLVSEISGGHPFDEAVSRPWAELANRFPANPVPAGCASTTVELRGQADVGHEQAATDATAIVDFLTLRGHVRGPHPLAPAASCSATPLEGCEAVTAPAAGIIVYAAELGARVSAGDLLAEIIDPVTATVTPVFATTAGVFFARTRSRFAETGMRLGKIAGLVPFRSGALLSP